MGFTRLEEKKYLTIYYKRYLLFFFMNQEIPYWELHLGKLEYTDCDLSCNERSSDNCKREESEQGGHTHLPLVSVVWGKEPWYVEELVRLIGQPKLWCTMPGLRSTNCTRFTSICCSVTIMELLILVDFLIRLRKNACIKKGELTLR